MKVLIRVQTPLKMSLISCAGFTTGHFDNILVLVTTSPEHEKNFWKERTMLVMLTHVLLIKIDLR